MAPRAPALGELPAAPRRYIYPRSALPAIGSAGRGVGPRSLAPSCRRALRPMARSPGSRLRPHPWPAPAGRAPRPWDAFSPGLGGPRAPGPGRRRRAGLQAPWLGTPSKEAQGRVRRKRREESSGQGGGLQRPSPQRGGVSADTRGAGPRPGPGGGGRPQARGSWIGPGRRGGHWQGRAFAGLRVPSVAGELPGVTVALAVARGVPELLAREGALGSRGSSKGRDPRLWAASQWGKDD
nr:translation initiation factor IF-2-like [Equus asinus]